MTPRLVFDAAAGLAILFACVMVVHRHPVKSVLALVVSFFALAVTYVLLAAPLIAAVQVIVYAGAILIFYLFVVMLLDLPDEEARPRFGAHWPLAAAVGLCFATLAWFARVGTGIAPAATRAAVEGPPQGGLAAIGMALFGPFALPFEMASLVLLAAIIGAVVLARRRAAGS